MSWGAAAGAAVGNIFDDARQYDLSSRMQEKSESFQDYMSSTSYQRSVLDMKRAGLNPMLAYMKGGAPTGSVGNPVIGGSHSSADAVRNAVQTNAQVDLTKAQTRNVNAEADRNTEIANVLKAVGPRIVQGVGAVEGAAGAVGEGVARVEGLIREALRDLPGALGAGVDTLIDRIKRVLPSIAPNFRQMPPAVLIREIKEHINKGASMPPAAKQGAFGSGAYSHVWGLSEYERAQQERFERSRESPASRRRGGRQ